MSRDGRGWVQRTRFEERVWRAIQQVTSFPRTTRGRSPSRTLPGDLLFGMLALRIGLIEQGQLVAALRAWL